MFDSVCFLLTSRCNMSCPYCFRPSAKKDCISLYKFTEGLKILRNLGTKVINISGGEPLLNPNWKECILAAKELGFVVNLTTNALLLNTNEEILSKLDILAISCDGIENIENQNRSITQLHQCLNVIKNYKKYYFTPRLKINTVVTRANIHSLENFGQQFLNDNNIIWMLFSYKRKGIYNTMSRKLEVDDNEFTELLSRLKFIDLKCRIMFEHSYNSLLNKNLYFLVTPDLDLYISSWNTDTLLGNLNNTDYLTLLEKTKQLGINYRFTDHTGEIEHVISE
ncbi:MAG: radical SAM protein [Lachnospiraceae bacterium]|nr:radical SAM protein [Lachnospiraceae bacterium]